MTQRHAWVRVNNVGGVAEFLNPFNAPRLSGTSRNSRRN